MSPPTLAGCRGAGGGGGSPDTMPPNTPPRTPPGIPPGTPPATPPSPPKSTALSGGIPVGISAGTVNVGPEAGAGVVGCGSRCARTVGGKGGGGGGGGAGISATKATIVGTSGNLSETLNNIAAITLPSTTTCDVADTIVAAVCLSRNGRSIVSAVRSNMMALGLHQFGGKRGATRFRAKCPSFLAIARE